MDYREILKYQLKQRQEMNPKYSLRAFAKKLSLSPSKVSEVLSGKKRLSVERVEEIAGVLNLSSTEKELFILSARIESSSKKIDREEMLKHIHELSSQINARRTTQRNAWYFGAIKVLEDAGYDANLLQKLLGITSLQVESAMRFIKRVNKLYPERKVISIEPMSVLRKLEEHFYSDANRAIETEFMMLSSSDQEELERKIKGVIKAFKLKSKNAAPENLKMIYWGCLKLNKE